MSDALAAPTAPAAATSRLQAERLVVETGAASPHPSGRGRVVLMPRNAASEPPPASSAPLPLRPSINLTPRQSTQQ